MNLLKMSDVKALAVSKLSRPVMMLVKNSPEILIVAGITGVVVATVMACRATLKVNEVLADNDDDLNNIHHVHETVTPTEPERYSEEDYQRDLAITYVKRAMIFLKLYGPSIVVGVLSIAAIVGSHHILSRRYVGVMAAYNVLAAAFTKYRKRVVEELGEEKDLQFRRGVHREVIEGEVVNEKTGKIKKVKKEVDTFKGSPPSQYAKFFDEGSIKWTKNADYNLSFLGIQQQFSNDLLKSHGHLFLNEVYDMLGLPRTSAGTVVGWVFNAGGDDYVDFGIYTPINADFVNGYERSILLDFNVDGLIWDMI